MEENHWLVRWGLVSALTVVAVACTQAEETLPTTTVSSPPQDTNSSDSVSISAQTTRTEPRAGFALRTVDIEVEDIKYDGALGMIGDELWLRGRPYSILGGDLASGAPVLRVDTANGKLLGSFDAGLYPLAAVEGFGSAWVANGSGVTAGYSHRVEGPGFPVEHSVQRVDLDSLELVAQIEMPWVSAVAVSSEWVWAVADDPAALYRIDPMTNHAERLAELGGAGAHQVAASDQTVWILGDQRLIRFDVEAGTALSYPISDQPVLSMAVGSEPWVLITGLKGVALVPTRDQSARQRISVPFPHAIAVDGRLVWIVHEVIGAATDKSRISAIDTTNGKTIMSLELGRFGSDLYLRDETVWIFATDALIEVVSES